MRERCFSDFLTSQWESDIVQVDVNLENSSERSTVGVFGCGYNQTLKIK